MARYGQAFKDRAVARLLAPESSALEVLALEVGVGMGTLQRWQADVQSMPARGRAWTARARLEAGNSLRGAVRDRLKCLVSRARAVCG